MPPMISHQYRLRHLVPRAIYGLERILVQSLSLKCLAQKLIKWRRIEKLWQKHEIERFSKIERFLLCKNCQLPSTKWLSFRLGWSDFAVITNSEMSSSIKAPNPAKFEELRNFRAMGRIRPPLANRVKI